MSIEIGGVDRCPECHYLLAKAEKKDDSWFVGFRVVKKSLNQYAAEYPKLDRPQIASFLVDASLAWAEATAIIGSGTDEISAGKDNYVFSRRCQLTPRGVALLKTMDQDTGMFFGVV